jgi:hypothetical protein
MPRQILETRRPDLPKLAYSTFDPLCSHPPRRRLPTAYQKGQW